MEEIWKILGIDPTRDTDAIRQAYRSKLILVNPEDDPEGFKQLRSAYEEADRLAKEPGEQVQPFVQKDTPVERWIEQVRERYETFSRRLDMEGWRRLFDDDVCTGLETAVEARTAFLRFTMEQYRLPHEVWVEADRVFHIEEEMEELAEQFPSNFLEFVRNAIRYESALDYRLFEGGDYGDYDSVIGTYFQLKTALDAEKAEDAKKLLQSLKTSGIAHPFFAVEEARLLKLSGERMQALMCVQKVYEQYPNENYIQYYMADLTLANGQLVRAKELFEELLVRVPEHFAAKLGLAECLRRMGEAKQARELCLELLELDGSSPQVQECLQSANEQLIAEYRQRLSEHPEDANTRLELGWCVFQNRDYEGALALLEGYEADEAHAYDAVNLTGRVYLCLNRYEEAYAYMTRWLAMIQETPDDGSEEAAKRKRRTSYAHYGIACAQMGLWEAGKGGSCEVSAEHMEKAVETEKNPGQRLMYQNAWAEMECKFGHYEKCVDLCQKILQKEPGYYMAYVNRQRAYYEMGYDREVLEDYYRAVEIFTGYIHPYLLAAKVYLRHDDAGHAREVVKKAEEAGLVSDELTLLKLRCARMLAQNQQESEDVLRGLEALCAKCGEEPLYEQVLCLMDLHRYEEALHRIEEVLLQNPKEDNYPYTKANILLQLQQYGEAEAIYRRLDEKRPGNSAILFKLGLVNDHRGKKQTAVEYYEKVLEVNENHPQANQNLKELYQQAYNRSGKRTYFDKALGYATRQLKIQPNDYYYIERGLLYLDGARFEEARADFEKAAELNPQNPYAYNNLGFSLQRQGSFREAIEQYRKAIEVMDNDPTPLPYINMSKCYLALKEYVQALETAKQREARFPGRQASDAIAEIYKDMGRFDQAAESYKRSLADAKADEVYYMCRIGYVYEDAGDYRQAEAWYQGALKKEPDSAQANAALGKFYLHSIADYRRAIRYLEKAAAAYEKAEDPQDSIQCLCYIGRCWWYLGKTKQMKESFAKAYERAKGAEGTTEVFENIPGSESYNCYWMGYICAHLGEYGKAGQYFARMEHGVKCRHCQYRDCEEAYMGRGLLAWLQGEKDKAEEYFQKCLAIEPLETECRGYLTAMKRKKKGIFGF